MQAHRRVAAAAADFVASLRGDGRGWVLLFVSLGWLAVLGGRIVYPALLPLITADFGIDYTTAGGLVGVLWASYALLQFPGGALADEVGERVVLTLSLVGSLLAVAVLAVAPAFGAFVVATGVLGVVNGLYGTTRVTVLSDTFPDMDTTAISINQATGNVGNAVLPVAAGVVAGVLGWRYGFGVTLPVFAVAAVGVWLVVPPRTSTASREDEPFRETLRAVSRAVRRREVVLVTGVLCLLMFLYQSVTGFLTTYLVDAKGLDSGTAAALYGGFFAVAIVVQFASGVVSDRYGQRLALSGFLAASVPAFVLLTTLEGFRGLVAAVALLSLVLGGFPPSHAYAVRAIPDEVQGSGYGLLRTLYIAFGAIGPPVVGLLADGGRFDEAFLALGGVALLASAASLLLPAVAGGE